MQTRDWSEKDVFVSCGYKAVNTERKWLHVRSVITVCFMICKNIVRLRGHTSSFSCSLKSAEIQVSLASCSVHTGVSSKNFTYSYLNSWTKSSAHMFWGKMYKTFFLTAELQYYKNVSATDIKSETEHLILHTIIIKNKKCSSFSLSVVTHKYSTFTVFFISSPSKYLDMT